MTSDRDVWTAALLMVRRYGDDIMVGVGQIYERRSPSG
jgi:hypothetical protein